MMVHSIEIIAHCDVDDYSRLSYDCISPGGTMPGRPMAGVRIVEVAQFTYVPAAGAVLADWGADVIKVEHAETGDAQRGFAYLGPVAAGGNFAPLMEHPNRGKRSIGLALERPEA